MPIMSALGPFWKVKKKAVVSEMISHSKLEEVRTEVAKS